MKLKALDLLRTIIWGIVNFIYTVIDTLFDILKSLNAYNIIDSIADNTIFSNFYTGIIAIALTTLALFIAWRFVIKILEPDTSMSAYQIVLETIKCSLLVLLSTFLFAEISIFSIKLSGFTGNIFESSNVSVGDSMLVMYIDYSPGYKESSEFLNEDIKEYVSNGMFDGKNMYNDKYVTEEHWILPNEKDYKYKINWILAILVGGFFLYALFFSGMMLARRQIEFLFLFVISPIIFATSIGNKQRRSAVIEQLVSLMLQGAVVLLIISLTALVMQQIQSTTFFSDSLKDILIKSILYVGCGSFLLTGSQVVNRFIGGNVSANSGREQLMSMMGYGNTLGSAASIAGGATAGASKFGLGAATGFIGRIGGNKAIAKAGDSISKFGNKISSSASEGANQFRNNIGNSIESFGNKVSMLTPSRIGKNLRASGRTNLSNAMGRVIPSNLYRKRYKGKGD